MKCEKACCMFFIHWNDEMLLLENVEKSKWKYSQIDWYESIRNYTLDFHNNNNNEQHRPKTEKENKWINEKQKKKSLYITNRDQS